MFLGAWGQKWPQNRRVWALALLGSWVAGMSVPLAGGEGDPSGAGGGCCFWECHASVVVTATRAKVGGVCATYARLRIWCPTLPRCSS